MWEYKAKDEKRLRNWFNGKPKDKRGFENAAAFISWYNAKDKICYYCGITESECQEIVHKGLLTSNRFAIGGDFTQRGKNRGYWLEIDRKKPKGKYKESNCELCCYFCNNDKSDVFTDVQYMSFRENRSDFLKGLLQ